MVIKKNSSLNISIIGDSFSSDTGPDSWVSMLTDIHNVTNYSQRGISEYRLYNNIIKNIEEISKTDVIIVFHTNPDRVFVPDRVIFHSRTLSTHTHCDMIAENALTDKHWKNIAKEYYTYFFDQSQQNCFYQLLVEKMNNLNLKQIIHCSGFDINIPFNSLHIKSFNDVMISNPGNINHLDLMGNQIVYNYVNSQFDTVNKEKIC